MRTITMLGPELREVLIVNYLNVSGKRYQCDATRQEETEEEEEKKEECERRGGGGERPAVC